jgi:hypothetical protein
MKRVPVLALSLIILTAVSGTWQSVQAQGSSELAGGWVVRSWTDADGTVNESPQRGLFIFTATGHYSMMYVPGDQPRPRYEGETQTDAETLAAYASFVANSGRYAVAGNRITYEAYVAKDPNYMGDWNAAEAGNAQNMTFSITDGTLALEWTDGFNVGAKATLSRPNQPGGDTE